MPSFTGPIIAASAIGASSIGSALIGSSAAQSAASTQANAANAAAQLQLQEYDQTKANLQPYVSTGNNALAALEGATIPGSANNTLSLSQANPSAGTGIGGAVANGTGANGVGSATQGGLLTSPFTPTMQSLAATPGYQFTLDQGLQATQNGYAAQGLASSGAALKGAANYAEGLAGTTYQQQFNNYLSQNQQIYNMLGGLASQGENAAAMTGTQGIQAVSAANALTTSGAAASAAGTVGSANALTGGLNGFSLAALYGANNGIFGSSNSGGGLAQNNPSSPVYGEGY